MRNKVARISGSRCETDGCGNRCDLSGDEEASWFQLQVRSMDPHRLSQTWVERVSSVHVDVGTA